MPEPITTGDYAYCDQGNQEQALVDSLKRSASIRTMPLPTPTVASPIKIRASTQRAVADYDEAFASICICIAYNNRGMPTPH